MYFLLVYSAWSRYIARQWQIDYTYHRSSHRYGNDTHFFSFVCLSFLFSLSCKSFNDNFILGVPVEGVKYTCLDSVSKVSLTHDKALMCVALSLFKNKNITNNISHVNGSIRDADMAADLEACDSTASNMNGVAVFPLKPNVPIVVLAEHGNGKRNNSKSEQQN